VGKAPVLHKEPLASRLSTSRNGATSNACDAARLAQPGPSSRSVRPLRHHGRQSDMSFLEMLDVLNQQLLARQDDPIAFDHDCREGICGCAHGDQRPPTRPQRATARVAATCARSRTAPSCGSSRGALARSRAQTCGTGASTDHPAGGSSPRARKAPGSNTLLAAQAHADLAMTGRVHRMRACVRPAPTHPPSVRRREGVALGSCPRPTRARHPRVTWWRGWTRRFGVTNHDACRVPKIFPSTSSPS